MDRDEYDRMYHLEDSLWWYVGMRRISLALLDAHLPPGSRGALRLLDAGCGTGGMLPHLRRYGEVWGIDLSPYALPYAMRRVAACDGAHLARASVLQLPFADGAFDVVTSFDVLYHLDVTDDQAALREVRRVLKPGGLALIRVPAYDRLRGAHDRVVHTRHRYTRAEVRQKLERAGLDPLYVTHANALLLPVAVAKRLLEGAGRESDVQATHPALNALLTLPLRAEALLVRHVSLPFGLSVVAVARRG
jgi:SAM-dependent methyltransferase